MLSSFLIGNAFPLSLIHRPVEITPQPLEDLVSSLQSHQWKSFWGHGNTLEAAAHLLGHDLTPSTSRPALTLDDDGFPSLDGESYSRCWILSPIYTQGFRPSIGEKAPLEKILSWHTLLISWK